MKGKILITGGAGYIGSHTAVELIKAGYETVIIDNLSNSSAEVIDRIAKISGTKPGFYQFDLCDKNQLSDFFAKEGGITGIIHFAASKAVGESVQEPLLYYRNNIVSLINLIEQMQVHGIADFVFSSSCTVYGQPDKLPVTEDTPFKTAESPYGNTKQICEEIMKDVANVNPDLNFTALRYFNPVGAHESAEIGELPLGVPANLVPFITQTAAGILKELSVFGDDYDTSDGTAVRDYIHVVDLAEAHVKAMDRLIEKRTKTNYEYFNVGTGHGSTVLEVIKSFEKVSGEKLNYRIVGRRAGDVVKIYANTDLANQELGWKATRNLDQMMEDAWRWQKKINDI